jgi:hypothetical protein
LLSKHVSRKNIGSYYIFQINYLIDDIEYCIALNFRANQYKVESTTANFDISGSSKEKKSRRMGIPKLKENSILLNLIVSGQKRREDIILRIFAHLLYPVGKTNFWA